LFEEKEMKINGYEIKREADLGGANLRRANLSGADLRRANLSGADLRWADLSDAILSGADLRRANLSGADLRWANLSGADLRWANLSGAILSEADLRRADLSGANLRWANLSGADLSEADLRWADLSGADLSEADLSEADLSGADLSGANLSEAKKVPSLPWTIIVPEGDLIVYKKVRGGIVTLLIPKDAKRSNGTTRKCRASKAIVLDAPENAVSCYDSTFKYIKGETVVPTKPFNENRWDECTSGIHFFLTKEEAEAY